MTPSLADRETEGFGCLWLSTQIEFSKATKLPHWEVGSMHALCALPYTRDNYNVLVQHTYKQQAAPAAKIHRNTPTRGRMLLKDAGSLRAGP